MGTPKLPRRRGRVLAIAALVIVAAVVAVIVASNSGSSKPGSAAGTTATGAATVQRRNLVSTDTESGTLSYDAAQTVFNRLNGTITWVPQVGQVIRPGHTLFTVDNRPVLLMDGSTPAYRDLTASDDPGPDVYELNRNLVNLGYNPDGIVIDDTWQAATTDGVEELQYHLGQTQTGRLTLGQVVFLPGPQMIQTVDTTVGSTGGGGSDASYTPTPPNAEFVSYSTDSGPAAGGVTDAATGVTDTTTDTTTGTTTDTTTGTTTDATTGTTTTNTTTDTAPGTTATPTTGVTTRPPETTTTTTHSSATTPSNTTHGKTTATTSGAALRKLIQSLRQQTAELKAAIRAADKHPSVGTQSPSSGPAKHSSSPSKPKSNGSTKASNAGTSGDGGGGSAVAVLGTSSTKLVVTVDLDASLQSEATIGEKVTVEMPNGGTQTGHVTAVSPVAQSSSSDDSGSGGGGADSGGSGSGSSTVPVTIVLDKPAEGGGLDQASVSVNFAQDKAKNVLSVPVTALLATSGSSFAVQEADSPHQLIPVHTGLFAAGYVEISGSGIHSGLRVTDSQG